MSYRNAALFSLANNELLNENEYSMKKLKSMQNWINVKWQKTNLRENLIVNVLGHCQLCMASEKGPLKFDMNQVICPFGIDFVPGFPYLCYML